MTDSKVIEQDTIPEEPLPPSVSWDTISDRPTSLADISITDATTLSTAAANAASATAGLGDLSIQGWTISSVFSATGQQAISWTAGTLKFKDGTTFSISSGSASGISTSVPTYIYFDKAASTTVLQTTTTATDSVGENKVLIAVAQGNSAAGKYAVLTAFGGAGGSSYVGTNQIAASSITSALIAAGTIVASNIAAGTITANEIAANTITANKMSVSTLSSITANIGSITAGSLSAVSISGATITGTTLTTASSGQRVVLTSTLAQFYNSSGTEIVETYASSNSYLIKGIQSTSNIYLDSGSAGVVAILGNGTIKIVADGPNNRLTPYTNGGIDLGVAGANWNDLYMIGTHVYQGIDQPVTYWGYCSGTTILPTNTAFSMTHPSTGKYTITHNFGTTNYVCVVTALRGSGAGAYSAKVEALGSTTVQITIFDDTGTVRDSDFMFIIALTP